MNCNMAVLLGIVMNIAAGTDVMPVTRSGQFAGSSRGPCAGARFA
jgi:hypothetical protein